jgi:N-methylhydantoinase B
VGRDEEGNRFSLPLFASAGMGASKGHDGLSATAFPTNSGAGSIEALEATGPILFRRKEFRPDSGGAGRQRGGMGQICEVENVSSEPVEVSIVGDRERHPALGVLGGAPGAVAVALLDDETPLRLKSRNTLLPGQGVTFLFAGGGGYGAPQERSEAAIENDLRNGFVSVEAAQRDYGRGAPRPFKRSA